MNKNSLLVAFCATLFFLACNVTAAESKIRLTCDFPAVEGKQKVKPGKNNVSDGVIRIGAAKIKFEICEGCIWQKPEAKWHVSPEQFLLTTERGLKIVIERKTGSAIFSLSPKEDELYLAATVESHGQCK